MSGPRTKLAGRFPAPVAPPNLHRALACSEAFFDGRITGPELTQLVRVETLLMTCHAKARRSC